MSLVHVFTIAEARTYADYRTAQLRYHNVVPWDEAQELYLDRQQLVALIRLLEAAHPELRERNKNSPNSIVYPGRIFDLMRAVREAEPLDQLVARDYGPYAIVTGSDIYKTREFVEFLKTLPMDELKAAWQFAATIRSLSLGEKQ